MKSLKYIIAVVILSLGLIYRVHATPTFPAPLQLNRTGTWLQNATEASGFVWGGNLYYVYSDRNMSGSSTQMKIVEPTLDSNGYITGQTDISTFGSGYGCQDALVDSGTLYVFATNCKMDFSHKDNSIVMYSTTDLTNWSGPTTIKTMDSITQTYNLTIAKAGSNYVLGYEVQNPSWYGAGFHTLFLTSSNLSSWSSAGSVVYNAPCPDLNYINSTYYMTFGQTVNGEYVTWMAKSTDLSTWTDSRITTLRPTMEYEDINTTDLDTTEFNGKVYGFYMVGDQSTYMRLTYFVFTGTLSQYIDAYQQPN